MADFKKDDDEIGALWAKTGAKGDYFTGTVNGERIVVFKNGNKKSDKSPDFRILKSKPKEQTAAPVDDFNESPF